MNTQGARSRVFSLLFLSCASVGGCSPTDEPACIPPGTYRAKNVQLDQGTCKGVSTMMDLEWKLDAPACGRQRLVQIMRKESAKCYLVAWIDLDAEISLSEGITTAAALCPDESCTSTWRSELTP